MSLTVVHKKIEVDKVRAMMEAIKENRIRLLKKQRAKSNSTIIKSKN